MSETAGGCVYDGYPLDGVASRWPPTAGSGSADRSLFDGYAGDPELTA